MVQFNFFRREVNIKIVFYGPGLAGKTTNLETLHMKTPKENRGELTSIATEQDKTLFFDFHMTDLEEAVEGLKTKLRLFTIPGEVLHNNTRKLVLQGADGVIFVADSQKGKRQENQESWKNLWENLEEHGIGYNEIPVVLQLNKRDIPDATPREEMVKDLEYTQGGVFEAIAVTGEGVFPTLQWVAKKTIDKINADVTSRAKETSSAPTKNSEKGFFGKKVSKKPEGPLAKKIDKKILEKLKNHKTQEQALQTLQVQNKLQHVKIETLDLSNKTFTEKIALENVEIDTLLIQNTVFEQDLCCQNSKISHIVMGNDSSEETELDDIETSLEKENVFFQSNLILKNVEIKKKFVICNAKLMGEVLWKNVTMPDKDDSVNISGSSFCKKFTIKDCKLGALVGKSVSFAEIKWVCSEFQGFAST